MTMNFDKVPTDILPAALMEFINKKTEIAWTWFEFPSTEIPFPSTPVDYTPDQAYDWVKDSVGFYDTYNQWFILAALTYIPLVFSLHLLMKKRTEFQLKTPLIVWNFLLAAFSILGAVHTIPYLYTKVMTSSFQDSICDNSCFTNPNAYWIFWFNMSKVPEFVDTVFLVLRKRPVIFLHWFHHIVTMLYCWFANNISPFFSCNGWWFASMNLLVHSIMYTYYFLAATGNRPSWGVHLTTLQILQMVVGIVVSYLSTNCEGWEGNMPGLIFVSTMYACYLFLFGKLFFDKYLAAKQAAKDKKAKKEKEAKDGKNDDDKDKDNKDNEDNKDDEAKVVDDDSKKTVRKRGGKTKIPKKAKKAD
eukprot:TRINITY_DN246_c0_g1_i1.p1 TRINITY_DN246_c0_g1~~TRINITY_DN246_c0_g1_i1.p1  ORF type:complete len:360 (+),score=137.08 TRINITY_DN246_c0_g1_i1:392-1471(+)